MSEDARKGVSIPGYQPVERLAESPSFGIWIRAVQTRLDRRVLLKVLPPTSGALSDFFAREILAMVRLEGHGILRLIDEGTAGAIRYMVIDEAGAVPLTSADRFGASEWDEIRTRLASVFADAVRSGHVLLPLPPSAFRRLPTGDVFVMELGWLVPLAAKLPAHEAIPAEWRGKPAQPGHNATFLATTMEQLAAAVDRKAPRWVGELAAALKRTPEDADEPLEALEMPTGPATPATPKFVLPLVLSLVVGLVGLGVWFQIRSRDADSDSDSVTQSDGSVQDKSLPGDPGPGTGGTAVDEGEAPVGDGAAEERELRAVAAQEAFEEAIGGVEVLMRRIVDGTPWRPEERAFLERAAYEWAETAWGEVAASSLRLEAIEARKVRAEKWRELRPAIQDGFAAGHVGRAEAALDRAVDALSEIAVTSATSSLWGGWWALTGEAPGGDLLEAESGLRTLTTQIQHRASRAEADLAGAFEPEEASVAGALEGWRQRLQSVGAEARAEIEAKVALQRVQRVYGPALEMIENKRPLLLAKDADWIDRLAEEVRSEGENYARAKRDSAKAREEAFRLCRESGDWAGAIVALEKADPGEAFPRLSSGLNRWLSWLEEGREAADALGAALKKRQDGDSYSYELAGEEERFRGTLVELLGQDRFALKREGRQGRNARRELAYSDLTLAELVRIDTESGRGAVPQNQWLLMLFFLGADERALKIAGALAAPPEWVAAARARFEKEQAGELRSLLAAGDAALGARDYTQLAQLVARLLEEFAPSDLRPIRKTHLERWLDGIYLHKGPVAAFPGAREHQWDPGTSVLSVLYEFDDEAAIADWNQVKRDRTDQVHGGGRGSKVSAMEVRGSAFLAPGGAIEIFQGRLLAEVRAKIKNGGAPNLNLILWSRRPFDAQAGLFAGFGYNPPQVGNLRGDEGVNNIGLPANVFGRLRDLVSRGNAHELFHVSEGPKVSRRKVVVAVSDDGEESAAALRSSSGFRSARSSSASYVGETYGPLKERLGTVEIRTFGSQLTVSDVWVEGRISPRWWDGWRRARIAEDLKVLSDK